MNLDTEAQELIFSADLAPNKWLAVGFSDNLIEADVI